MAAGSRTSIAISEQAGGTRMARRSLLAGLAVAAASGPAGRIAHASEAVDAARFRADGLNDRQVLAAAFAEWARRGGGVLRLEPGHTYNLGEVLETPDLFAISGLDQALLDGAGASIVARSRTGQVWNLLSFSNVANLTVRSLRFSDAGYRDEAWGMKAVVLQPGSTGSERIRLEHLVGDRVLSLVQAQGPADVARVAGIVLGPGLLARRSYYAVCCQDQGDGLVGEYTAEDCRRAYFAHGVERHRISIAIDRDPGGAFPGSRNPVLIKSYGRDTLDLSIAAHFTGSLPWSEGDGPGACIGLEHQPQSGLASHIGPIELAVAIEPGILDRFGAGLLVMDSIGPDGAVERETRNTWRRIELNAQFEGYRGINLLSDPPVPCDLVLRGDVDRMIVRGEAPNVKVVRAARSGAFVKVVHDD